MGHVLKKLSQRSSPLHGTPYAYIHSQGGQLIPSRCGVFTDYPVERGSDIEAKKYEVVTDGGNSTEGQAGANHLRLLLPGLPEWSKEMSKPNQSQSE